ncbi:MAG: flagellar motor protein MotB [Thermodesulfobacteriota bacterium]|nr:flagellar motor protein MotB [Thermodesulfobacteriota bacterium]
MANDKKKEQQAQSTEAPGTVDDAAPGMGSSDDEPAEEGIIGAPPWMATFADMVTLLMCFFVLLFSMSTIQNETFKMLVKSLQSALGVEQVPEAGTSEGVKVQHKIPQEEKDEPEKPVDPAQAVQREVDDIVMDVRELIMYNKLGGKVRVQGDETGAVITISDVVLFPPGGARISTSGLDIMAKLSKVLSGFSYHITVAGHTDNRPIHTAKFASNWELSANRACEVVRYLIARGLDPRKVSAAGYAEYHPIASNSTQTGRAKNRRVEIIYERRSIAKAMGVDQ